MSHGYLAATARFASEIGYSVKSSDEENNEAQAVGSEIAEQRLAVWRGNIVGLPA
ncbi:hypothetical protein [Mesorhizobium sp. 131-3-5]|uniref:hypothetical protein n=1 Tax=Mesorhizobium sp. 131-3-5 TaxID=2744520 RepID=UPI0018ED0DB7|nr:hypothetical protein [Mesorhizobium sp. 131-3-5]